MSNKTDDKCVHPSKTIETFLDAMREYNKEYSINKGIIEEKDKETQDILHKTELEKLKYHEHARINIELTKTRQERRKAKDAVMVLELIVSFTEQNKKFMDSLSELLGRVRKEEKRLDNRFYNPKSEKYKNI